MTLLCLMLVVPSEHWGLEVLAELPAQPARLAQQEPAVQKPRPARLGWPARKTFRMQELRARLVLREPPVQQAQLGLQASGEPQVP